MIISIKNAVNTRLFGAYEPQKIIFDLSYYTKSRPAFKPGGFFAWIDHDVLAAVQSVESGH